MRHRCLPLIAAVLTTALLAPSPAEARADDKPAHDPTFASYRTEGSQPEYGIAATYNVLIHTRDGDEVAADIYLPAGGNGAPVDGPWPTVLQYTPYDKQSGPTPQVHADAAFFTPRGYATVIADIPGEGNSSGAEPDGILDPRTTRAGYDVIEWIAAQSWSDGKVGMHGDSFPGFIANRVMGLAPPHLTAVFSVTSDSDYYLDVAYPGGLFALNNQVGFGLIFGEDQVEPPNLVVGEDPQRYGDIYAERLTQTRNLILEVQAHPNDGPWWQRRSPDDAWDHVRASVLQMGGWRDLFLRGNVRNYVGIHPREGAVKRLLIGPWSHADRTGIDEYAAKLWFFDSELKGMRNGVRDPDRVDLYIQGIDEWRRVHDWPVAGTRTERLWLRATTSGSATSLNDGSLLPEAPPGGEPTDTLVYEPTTAGYGEGGELAEVLVPPLDQRAEEIKKLTFTTEPFSDDVLVIGSPSVRLFASSSARETQFSVKVTDVAPDGTSRLLKEGWLNATHRSSHVDPRPLEPGRVYPFDIEVWPIGNMFLEGHRLRLDVALSDFPRVLGSEQPSTVTVFHDADRVSFLDVPVVEGTTGGPRVDRPRPPAGSDAPAGPADVSTADAGTPLPSTGGGWALQGLLTLAGAGLLTRRRVNARG